MIYSRLANVLHDVVMGDFLSSILAFPTALFSALLGIILLYWLAVLVGLLDVDALDPTDATEDDAGGATAGPSAGDARGAVAAGDSADDEDASGKRPRRHARGFRGVGLGGVPRTISLSILVLTCWIVSLLGMRFLRALAPSSWLVGSDGVSVFGALVGVLAVVLGLAITVVTVRPLRQTSGAPHTPRRRALIGSLCTITSQRVDARGGQAQIEDDDRCFRIDVRCFRPNALTHGAQAVIYEYDDRAEVYHVAPAEDAIAIDGAARRQPRRIRRRHRPCPSLP